MRASHHRVALVDDDTSTRKAISRLLRTSGYVVYTFASGQELLESPTLSRTACLLVDLKTPDLSGLDLLRALDDRAPQAPVIIMSGYDDPLAQVRCLAAGARAFIRKPFDEKVLIDAITNALDRS